MLKTSEMLIRLIMLISLFSKSGYSRGNVNHVHHVNHLGTYGDPPPKEDGGSVSPQMVNMTNMIKHD